MPLDGVGVEEVKIGVASVEDAAVVGSPGRSCSGTRGVLGLLLVGGGGGGWVGRVFSTSGRSDVVV